jgi:hypothetical protein
MAGVCCEASCSSYHSESKSARKKAQDPIVTFEDTQPTVVGMLRQRLRGHQSFQEASLLSKPAATQWIHIPRLIPENKGGFPYTPVKAGYRNGGYSLFHT